MSERPQAIRIGGRTIRVPGRRWQRTLLGISLVLGGIVGFLPVVGFWMIPLGIAVLAVDSPRARRLERRFKVKTTRIYLKALNGVRNAVPENGKGR
ncbi:MAG: PGPGW domain-containing protein [Flavobacteriaceae bacterium]